MTKKSVARRPGLIQQREKIAQAAMALLGGSGGSGASVTQICRAANVSRDTFYRCFDDRDDLLNFLYQTAVHAHVERVMTAWDMDYGDKAWLRRVTGQTIDAILEQHEVAQFLFTESAVPGSPANVVVQRAYQRVARRMQRWCRDTYNRKTPLEYWMALLVATQWLVHNAIVQQCSPRAVTRAKAATEKLFYAAFNAVAAGEV
jgi:AcrR family transcriptional regulator